MAKTTKKEVEKPSIKTKEFEVKKNYCNLNKGDKISLDANGEKFYKSINVI